MQQIELVPSSEVNEQVWGVEGRGASESPTEVQLAGRIPPMRTTCNPPKVGTQGLNVVTNPLTILT